MYFYIKVRELTPTVQVFGVCCNKEIPAGFKRPEDLPPAEEEDFVVEEFPIEFSVAENCGSRTVPLPQVTLYNPLAYIVNGYEARKHEYPFMVSITDTFACNMCYDH